MAQVRVAWTEAWAAPGESSAETSFRLVQTDDDGLEWAIERELTDTVGGSAWTLVTYLKDSSTLDPDMSAAGLTQNVFAALFAVIYHKRRF